MEWRKVAASLQSATKVFCACLIFVQYVNIIICTVVTVVMRSLENRFYFLFIVISGLDCYMGLENWCANFLYGLCVLLNFAHLNGPL